MGLRFWRKKDEEPVVTPQQIEFLERTFQEFAERYGLEEAEVVRVAIRMLEEEMMRQSRRLGR